MKSFRAEIFIIGINPHVIPPDDVLDNVFTAAGKNKGAIPVKAVINGIGFDQTLVKFSGKWRLYLNGIVRKATGLGVGDFADIGIEFNSQPEIIPMNEKLLAALNINSEAMEAFRMMSPSHQREIMRYINNLKSEETIDRNIERAIMHITGKGRFVGRD